MKKLKFTEMESIQAGRFFGPDNEMEAIDDNSCASGLRVGVFSTYYILGIRTKHELAGTGPCLEATDTIAY
ncbi:hypothetical protein [Nubsella zeaxanthinifaciens]|uniref:hypothetical protein n=1 Tax=Nubsella zeaxanthinifaciens TaxID=392412 RepID=UPI000DE48AA8|nr:hypothetical protein [Nubsella zeaxanthinifaciens]